jgi:hypothetical protein
MHQEKIAYLDCLSIRSAILNLEKSPLGWMNSHPIKPSSIRNHSTMLPRRSLWSNIATGRHRVLEDHSQRKPLQLRLNPGSTDNDSESFQI